MPTYTQTNRHIAITTPLGKDVLLLRAFTGREAISQLFHFDLELLSENDAISFKDVVGTNVTLRILDADGAERHWNGFISRFSQGAQTRRLTAYRAQMVPWLWFLTRTADCRIFQNQNVPDIIRKVFADLRFQDYKLKLYGNFDPRDYCVQYRETDFNFVSRLMEEEGIYYYFEHSDRKHMLILANDPAAHEACPGQATARYDFRGGSVLYEDVVTEWKHEEEFRPGCWAQTDYNFETPSTDLKVTVNGKNPYEIYEYPGDYRVREDGDKLARIRLEEQTVPEAVIQASSGCRHFDSGYKFTLKDHYRGDENNEYLITAVRHVASAAEGYEAGSSGGGGDKLTYRNSFECILFSTPFRPPRATPEPYVQDCQTAVVVGPAGQEVYTDKYGRVKVQFHWDREGKKNENSSCWIRVSHPWAGQGWGAVSIPRIGQEVIVDFLEGDPDQPIIVGRVYNAEQMPPNRLPAAGMVSGIKSNSTPGGGGYNEMSMDDTKGKEKITIHAQYNMGTTVENDNTNTIKNNETTTVIGNRTETVNKKEKITIIGGREENVSAGEKITITGGREENVTGNEKITITGPRTESVTGAETITITGHRDETVTAGEVVNITGATTHSIAGPLEIKASTSIKLIVGGSTITLLPGSIEISSPEITVTGNTIESGAQGSHKIRGASVTISGDSINSSASGTHEITGGMVKIN